MKKLKGLVASVLVFTILISNISLSMANVKYEVEESIVGGYKTLDEPIPVRS